MVIKRLLSIVVHVFFSTILILSISHYSNAQSIEKPEKIKPYRIWVIGEEKVEGLLYDTTDSSIFIIRNVKVWKVQEEANIYEIKIKNVNKVKLRKKGRVKGGAIVGFIIGGSGFGTFAGFVAYSFDGKSAVPGATMAGIAIGGVVGAGIGSLLGSIKKSYNIQYSLNIYQSTYIKEIELKSLIGQGLNYKARIL